MKGHAVDGYSDVPASPCFLPTRLCANPYFENDYQTQFSIASVFLRIILKYGHQCLFWLQIMTAKLSRLRGFIVRKNDPERLVFKNGYNGGNEYGCVLDCPYSNYRH